VLEYSRTPDRQTFMINGRVMDEGRVDERVRLGDTEEWTIINTDQQYHASIFIRRRLGDRNQTAFARTKTVCVTRFRHRRRRNEGRHSEVVIPFTDPVIAGRFVYHCHAVDHEDKGMMGVVEVAA